MNVKLVLLAAALALLAACDQVERATVLAPVESDGDAPAPSPQKRRVGPITFTAAPEGGHQLASTLAIGPEDFEPPWPIVSVVTDEANLHDPKTGIFANIYERGREWERPASMSYFEDGKLVFATGVGIRLHGGSTRHRRKQKRIRVYFRSDYGATAFASGLLFGPEAPPIRTLVVRTDDQHFASPLAFDISRRLGADAPKTRPALFFLNGESLGQYYLVEHQSRKQRVEHVGHDDFVFYRFKSNDPIPPEYRALDRWARNPRSEISIETVEQRIDLDNLTRHLFSVVYCATNDWIQGEMLLDERQPVPRWRFLNWDMDHSFIDYGAGWKQGKRPTWEQEAMELLFSHVNFRNAENPEWPITRGDLRKVIFSRLWRDSPEYRARFVRLAMDLMNHRLDREFLLARIGYYRDTLGVPVPHDRESFLLHRADFVRSDIQKWFELGEIFDVSLDSPTATAFDVDGYPEGPGYRGRYFAGTEIRVGIAATGEGTVSGWLVNGEEYPGTLLTLAVTSDLEIAPIFR